MLSAALRIGPSPLAWGYLGGILSFPRGYFLGVQVTCIVIAIGDGKWLAHLRLRYTRHLPISETVSYKPVLRAPCVRMVQTWSTTSTLRRSKSAGP